MYLIMSMFLLIPTLVFADSDPRVRELKREILELARQSEGKTDRDGKLQAALEVKVQDLEKVIPYLTMQEKARRILGPWRQVFGPYSATGDGTIPVGSRTDHIYQIVNGDGTFYNVALFELAGVRSVFLLKGEYKVTSEAIEGVFVRNSLLLRNIPERGLHLLPAELEAGRIRPLHLPRSVPPVGQGGQLIEVYADADFRVLRGLTPQFERPALYIMERAK